MRKVLLMTAAAAFAFGFVASVNAQTRTVIIGGSTSVGAGGSLNGGGTTTTSGTTFGGSGSTAFGGGAGVSSGAGYGKFVFGGAKTSGAVSGSTYQTSSTNGTALAGSYSTSNVGVCAGPGC